MNASIVRAERHATVRRWARGWKRERLIDDVTLAAIERAYPDDRRRLGPVFRVLAFVFTVFAVGAAFALVVLLLDSHRAAALGIPALSLGAALWVATDGLKSRLRLVDAGVESATALAGAALLTGGAAYLTFEVFDVGHLAGTRLVLLSAVLLLAAAAVRWGSGVAAALATLCLGHLLSSLPGARLSWTLSALLLAPFALRGSESARLAPSHRRACAAVMITALAGLYIALHLGSWDARVVERGMFSFHLYAWATPLPLPRAFFKLTTALVPMVLLAYAIATRRRPLLAVGLALGVASLITLRFYVHIADLWIVLSAAGSGLIVLALGLRRWLDSGTEHERSGWTARGLSGDTALMRATEMAVAVIAATPSANTPDVPRFEGDGGRSGGGGASTDF